MTEYRYDRDGRMHARDACIAKAGVADYNGDEVPHWRELGLDPKRVYRILRHPDEFMRAAKTFKNLPLFSEHAYEHDPRLVIGATGSNIRYRSDGFLVGDIAVWARKGIDAIEHNRTPALSIGFDCLPLMFKGRFNGERYDGALTRMRGRHIALVPWGRSGIQCQL